MTEDTELLERPEPTPENDAPATPTLRERVKAAVDARDAEQLQALLEPLPLSAALRQLLALSADDRDRVLELVPTELAAALVEEAPHAAATELVERLEWDRAAEIIDVLDSDLQADLIGDLDSEDAEAILAELEPEDAADVRRLVAYEDDTAGGLMVAEAFKFPVTATVGAVLRSFVDEEQDFERYRGQHPYVIDTEGRPVGVVSLRGLLVAKRSAKLGAIMIEPIVVTVDTTLDDLQDLFDRHSFLGLPVVEADGRLVGVVSRAAIDAAALERAESETLRLQGVVGDELRSMPTWLRSRRRLMWLTANIVLNVIAASVISAYEETLAAVIAIAVFLPMVSDMSGCSGNQAVGVTMRELSLGVVQPKDAMRVWLKELSVGVINGLALGVLIGLVAWFWKGNVWLGAVIGAALALNTVLAVSIGGVVPLLLKRLGQGPAAASGPLLTTITDMAGFFLVLSLASLLMPYLI
ncbi:magnesium transporter [Sinirhodobacter sp. WL0062]|uniref:Magnesium transporter MgtE n=1 Tax=Rhodobacter flavimaris TaxID=2907145 RepID=A0ABS8YRL5_9RHOB|nr:magnesium transporter [Sinirhodobacter sp. WL0062]MCE5972517.1 magnesium transporter [Sinirhodobacter sp. WL0062]